MEINQELRLQLAKYKQDFRDLTEKFLISQATAYSLANQLQKYKCEACKDIVESVLGEKLLFEVWRPAEKPADKPMLDERLRTCDTLIRSQARELTQLRQTLQDGKDDSVLLKKHLKDLLTHNDQGSHQGQGFRERLSEGYRLAERIACKLSPEIYEDEDDEQAQEKLTPSMELQEVEKREVPEESRDECGLMPSILQRSSDSLQPYSNDKFKFNDLEADLGQDGACGCSHAKEDEIPTNISGSPHVISPHKLCRPKKVISEDRLHRHTSVESRKKVSYGTQTSDNENYHKPMSGQELPFPSVNMQDDEKKVVFQQSQDECVSVPSSLQEGSACNQPYSDGEFALDEENVASAMDGACGCSHAEEDEIPTGLPENQNDHDDMKGLEVVAPRFSRQLPQMRQNGVPQDSRDEYYLTSSVLPGLSDSFSPYRSNAIFSLEDVDVSYARDVTKNLADLEDEEDQDIISSSDLKRTKQTVHGILEKNKFCKDATVKYDSRLRERKYGAAEGRPLSELRAMAKAVGEKCPAFTPPGGETLDQLKMHGKDFFEFLCQLILKEASQNEQFSQDSPSSCLESSLAEIFPLGKNCASTFNSDSGAPGLAASVLVVSHGAYMRSLLDYFLTDLKCSFPATLSRSELT
ncbi:hypothetical protein MJT46_001119 [Ovis ammon polii x Ovis aries]|nr:hypothetical protein MJT46_001119 [Ovis ammon polii x Ovis aries]